MSQLKVIVLRTAGTNCDQETVHAWELAGATPERVHVRELIETPGRLDEFAILTIPGGFSYGDDI
jgi:phosphoribosylformylglycinamidine synthase subunit PurQ / glutaminase